MFKKQINRKSDSGREFLSQSLKTTRATLSDQEFDQFTRMLCMAVADTNYYDSTSNEFIEIKEAERPEKIAGKEIESSSYIHSQPDGTLAGRVKIGGKWRNFLWDKNREILFE